jgi:hypothetical protein
MTFHHEKKVDILQGISLFYEWDFHGYTSAVTTRDRLRKSWYTKDIPGSILKQVLHRPQHFYNLGFTTIIKCTGLPKELYY